MNNKLLSKRRTLTYTFVAISLCMIGTFLIAEIYVRMKKPYYDLWEKTGRAIRENPMKKSYSVDAFSAYKAKPGTYFTSENLNKSVNKYGFISSPEIDLVKPENTIRILFLGGSSTAGVGGKNMADKDTWPTLTSKILQAKYRNHTIEYINGALGGYTTFESYGRLWSRVRFFSPDIVVLNHAWNEMYYFRFVDDITTWRTASDGSWSFDRLPKELGRFDQYWFDHLIRYSQLFTRLRFRVLGKSDWVVEKSVNGNKNVNLLTNYDERALEIFRTNLKLIKESVKLFSAKLYVIKQPTLITSTTSKEDKKRCRYRLHGFGHDAHVDAFNQIYQIITEEIDEKYIIDLTEFSGISENFHDHIHPTKLGAKIIAEKTSKSLENEFEN